MNVIEKTLTPDKVVRLAKENWTNDPEEALYQMAMTVCSYQDKWLECLKKENEASKRVYAVITQHPEWGYDFELIPGHQLDKYLRCGGGNYIFLTNIKWGCQKFFTSFDNAEYGMPNEEFPFAGMVYICSTQEGLNELGGSRLVWLKHGDSYRAYDYDVWVEENKSIENLNEYKNLGL